MPELRSALFCPKRHLLLAAARCPQCGWQRPPARRQGEAAWGALELGAGLGGPGTGVFARPAVAGGRVVWALRDGELVTLELATGQVLRRESLESGMCVRQLVADAAGAHVLLALSDERAIESAGAGRLEAYDPRTALRRRLWQIEGDASLLSPPAVGKDCIVLRTSKPELVCLESAGQPSGKARPGGEVRWRLGLWAWGAQAPVLAQDAPGQGWVALADVRPVLGEGRLLVVELATGRVAWELPTGEMPQHAPLFCGEVLVYFSAKNDLACLDLASGHLRWQRCCERIYSELATDGRWVYLVLRGEKAANSPQHYLLAGLDLCSGEIAWRVPLPARARLLSLVGNGLLAVADEQGRVLAFRPGSDSPAWQYVLGSAEDPLQSHFVEAGGLLLVGSYHGRVAALQLEAPAAWNDPAILADPANPYARGELLQAAEAYALAGDLEKAGNIFALELGEPELGLALFRHAGKVAEAAQALHAAADSAAARLPEPGAGQPDEQWIAHCYALAANCYAELGDEAGERTCRGQAAHFQRLPQVVVEGKTERPFQELRLTRMALVMRNRGRGAALDICVQIDARRFEVELDGRACKIEVNRLAPGAEVRRELFIRPLKDQIGEVPLVIECTWRDGPGNLYRERSITPVVVKSSADATPSGQPVVIQVQGNYIAGDEVHGDLVESGGRKGDSVDIHAAGRVSGKPLSLEDGGETAERLCPHCRQPAPSEAIYCTRCGHALAQD